MDGFGQRRDMVILTHASTAEARGYWFATPTAVPYTLCMHTVIETPEYLRDAKAVGLTDHERLTIVDTLASHPDAGGAQRAARDSGRDCHHLPARSTTA